MENMQFKCICGRELGIYHISYDSVNSILKFEIHPCENPIHDMDDEDDE